MTINEFMTIRFKPEKLESIRFVLSHHLNELYNTEQTIDNYDELKELTVALEYCLESIDQEIVLAKNINGLIEIPN